jgi:hypothetical protein
MIDKTLEQKNREVVEWLGCWHEPYDMSEVATQEEAWEKDCKCRHCGRVFVYPNCNPDKWNHNYILHPEELLLELVKRDDRDDILLEIGPNRIPDISPFNFPQPESLGAIYYEYITNQTGKLVKTVWQWMKEEKCKQ